MKIFINSASLGVEIEHKKANMLIFFISALKWPPVLVRQNSTRRLKFWEARITLDGSIAAVSRDYNFLDLLHSLKFHLSKHFLHITPKPEI